MSALRKPNLSYMRLPNGLSTVTCTCGWRDPLGPVPPSPYDPGEALMAALAEHPFCTATVQTQQITEHTTFGELHAICQRLNVQALTVSVRADGTRVVHVSHSTGTFVGDGMTEAVAFNVALSKLQEALTS